MNYLIRRRLNQTLTRLQGIRRDYECPFLDNAISYLKRCVNVVPHTRRGRNLPEFTHEKILDMLNRGYSVAHICEICDVSKTAVYFIEKKRYGVFPQQGVTHPTKGK